MTLKHTSRPKHSLSFRYAFESLWIHQNNKIANTLHIIYGHILPKRKKKWQRIHKKLTIFASLLLHATIHFSCLAVLWQRLRHSETDFFHKKKLSQQLGLNYNVLPLAKYDLLNCIILNKDKNKQSNWMTIQNESNKQAEQRK